MNQFVPTYPTQQLLPPWTSHGCENWGFAIEIKRDRVAASLNTYFNGAYGDAGPAPFRYEPLEGGDELYGLIVVLRHPKVISSAEPPMGGRDELDCQEVHWAVPVLRYAV